MKKMMIFFGVLMLVLFFAMNGEMIKDTAFKWADENPKDPGAAKVLLRAGWWCDVTGSDEQALQLYKAVWDRYPDDGSCCAQALYETAYYYSQTAARRNANVYLDRIINEYGEQEKWRLKAKALWDEVNHVL